MNFVRIKNRIEKFGLELTYSKHVDGVLEKRVKDMERQFWSNSQYSRQEWRDVTSISGSTESKDLWQTAWKVFEKLELMVNLVNVENFNG